MNLLYFFSFNKVWKVRWKMKKILIALCILTLTITTANAKPHHGGHHPKGHIMKPPHHHTHHARPYYGYHHSWGYYNYRPCTCYDPYCIHRRHLNGIFRISPHFSIGVSI